MNVTLVHPIHGAKVAISEQEMADDLRNGWVKYNPDTPVKAASESVAKAPKHKHTRKVTEQPIEHPSEVPEFLTSVNGEPEGR